MSKTVWTRAVHIRVKADEFPLRTNGVVLKIYEGEQGPLKGELTIGEAKATWRKKHAKRTSAKAITIDQLVALVAEYGQVMHRG